MRNPIAASVAGFGLLLAMAVAALGTDSATRAATPGDLASVRAFLAHSAAAWNRGDLDGFMRGYAKSPATLYLSRSGVIRGYEAIRAHYAGHYGTRMGTLAISDLSVRSLGPAYELALARWHLTLPAGRALSGPFSLILERHAGGWRIIEDATP